MTFSAEDTIAAPISAAGRAAVHLVRISGGRCKEVLAALVKDAKAVLDNPRKLVLAYIIEPSDNSVLDLALCVFFQSPNSYTGEDCIEINLHGSPYILARLFEILSDLKVRMAQAGEFTHRAFINGRMDLSQAEAIADLIASESEQQARAAQAQLEGNLKNAIFELGEPIRNMLAEVEAWIDFPEEEVQLRQREDWLNELDKLRHSIDAYLNSYSVGRVLRDGANVVLAGVPNVGKSSLFNLFAGEPRAIVTSIPGTTRDTIELRLSLDGLLVKLWDTAGLSLANSQSREIDEVEQLGVDIAIDKAKKADLLLFVIDSQQDVQNQCMVLRYLINKYMLLCPIIVVFNKIDICDDIELARFTKSLKTELPFSLIFVSTLTKQGFLELKSAIKARLVSESRNTNPTQVFICNGRHYQALKEAKDAINRAKKILDNSVSFEFLALELHSALGALSDIIGVTTAEDILERIFSKFCLGK